MVINFSNNIPMKKKQSGSYKDILALTEKLKEYGIELREKHNLKRLMEKEGKNDVI